MRFVTPPRKTDDPTDPTEVVMLPFDRLIAGPDAHLRRATLTAMASSRRDERLAELAALDDRTTRDLLAFAERNRVAPVVAHALRDAKPEARDVQQWHQVHEASLRRMR